MQKKFPIIESFEYGFKTAWNHIFLVMSSTFILGLILLLITGLTVLFGVIGGVLGLVPIWGVYNIPGAMFAVGALVLLGCLFAMGFILGYYKIMLEIKDTDESHVSTLWSMLHLGFLGFLAIIIKSLIIFLIGFLPLLSLILVILKFMNYDGLLLNPESLSISIAPIIVMVLGLFIIWWLMFILQSRLSYFLYFIIDQNAGIIESLRLSWSLTKGYTLYSVLFMFLYYLVGSLGIYIFGVGLLFTVPVAKLAMAYTYRWLLAQKSTKNNLSGQ